MKNEVLTAALKYCDMGYSVIPCQKNKRPFFKWAQFQEKRADEKLVREWWERYPDANVGIVTGKISNLCVVDVDGPNGRNTLAQLLPEEISTPISMTPGGGWHHYYKAQNGTGNSTRFIEECDFRGEGGYAILPPSVGQNGKRYAWMPGMSLFELQPAALPQRIASILKNTSNTLYKDISSIYIEETTRNCSLTTNSPHKTTSNHKLIPHGKRDDTLFHIAFYLSRGKMPIQEIEYYLSLIAHKCCETTKDLPDIQTKIRSAIKRVQKAVTNVAQEVREWALTTSGYWLTTDCHRELQVTTKEDKKAAMMEILRMVERGELTKHSEKRGCYRRVDSDCEVIKWEEADSNPIKVCWPLEVERYALMYPKTLGLVAGTKDSGKTAWALNMAKLNSQRFNVRYLSSEMSGPELKGRLEKFEFGIDEWKAIDFRERSRNFADAVVPNGLTIIDFLEISGEKGFWVIADELRDIYDRIDKGIAIIFLQKDPRKELGRGDTFSQEKPRIYLTLDRDPPNGTIANIKVGKVWAKQGVNPVGLKRRFWLKQGALIYPDGDWETS